VKLKARLDRSGFWLSDSFQALLSLLVLFCLMASPALNARQQSEPVIRVKLGGLHKKLSVSCDSGKVLNSHGRRIRTLRKNRDFSWNLPGSRGRINYLNQTLTITSRNDIVSFNGKKYRGRLLIKFTNKGAIVVNHLGIENYLKGVVGSEMGSLSPSESLKAQTVIARTYAYSNKGKHGRDGADVCDSTHCQVYKGISSERPTINKAVAATRGIFMVSNGKPIQTLYHAACGGMTSDNDKVFGGGATSYLRRVVCPFCSKSPYYRWSKTLTIAELQKGLTKEKITFNKLYKVDYSSPAPMDRVAKIYFATDRGNFSVKGTTFRRLFSLRSTTFTLGNRRSIKELIAMASEVIESRAGHSGIMLASLGTQVDDGPPQLIIQAQRGLKRVRKPEEGWKVISYGKLNTAVTKEKNKTSAAKIPQNPQKPLSNIEIFGRGFGHQVGLCQAGAIEMGRRKWSYRQILPFYYSDVALRQLNY
jgi:stage II sporulation protein D